MVEKPDFESGNCIENQDIIEEIVTELSRKHPELFAGSAHNNCSKDGVYARVHGSVFN
jgi:hypothetical protein